MRPDGPKADSPAKWDKAVQPWPPRERDLLLFKLCPSSDVICHSWFWVSALKSNWHLQRTSAFFQEPNSIFEPQRLDLEPFCIQPFCGKAMIPCSMSCCEEPRPQQPLLPEIRLQQQSALWHRLQAPGPAPEPRTRTSTPSTGLWPPARRHGPSELNLSTNVRSHRHSVG